MSDFTDWYAAYPRHIAPRTAERAYNAALGRGATPAMLLHAIQRQQWHADPKMRPYPATWLNGDRWLDEPDPPPLPSFKNGFIADAFRRHVELFPDDDEG